MSDAKVIPIRGDRPWLPEGVSAAEYTMRDGIINFRRGDHKSGIINLAHAWLWAVTDSGQLDMDDAKELFRQVTEAAGAWDVGA